MAKVLGKMEYSAFKTERRKFKEIIKEAKRESWERFGQRKWEMGVDYLRRKAFDSVST